MSRLVLNRDGGMTDEFGHMLGLSRMTSGDVVEGLAVVQKSSPTMDILVQYGVAKIQYGTLGTRYDYWVCNDADATVTIPTADTSSPRIDIILAVVDRTVTPSSTIANNNNNMLKFVVASGTPSGVATDPSTSQMQAAAGTGNPYIKLARIYVDAGRTQITSAQIVNDLRNFARVTTTTAINFADATGDFIANGTGTLSSTSGLTGGLSDITYYIAATRYFKTNIPNKTYVASKDTYVYIDIYGNISYTATANGATAPSTPSGTILIGIVKTNASSIVSILPRSRGATKAANLDYNSGIWWEELSRVKVSGSDSPAFTLDSGVIPAKRYLKIIANITPTTNLGATGFQFNGDGSNSNYYYRISTNGAADSTGSASFIPTDLATNNTENFIVEATIKNFVDKYKIVMGTTGSEGLGTTGFPSRRIFHGKWNNDTTQITRIYSIMDNNNGCKYGPISEMIVWGHD